LYQVNSGSANYASGVTITSSLGTGTSSSLGVANVLIATNDTVTFSGAGYQSVSLVIYGSDTEMVILVPPTLSPTELFTCGLWLDTTSDLDWHMFGPGNRTQYPTDEGVVNWAWVDKSLESPYATWQDESGVVGIEVTQIAKLNYSAPYDFMLFLWSRVGGDDPTVSWASVQASIFIYGGSATGIGSYSWHAVAPTPPAGTDYGYWSPFTLQPNGQGGLTVIQKSNPFDPPISISDIDANTQLYYACEYPDYCPYPMP